MFQWLPQKEVTESMTMAVNSKTLSEKVFEDLRNEIEKINNFVELR